MSFLSDALKFSHEKFDEMRIPIRKKYTQKTTIITDKDISKIDDETIESLILLAFFTIVLIIILLAKELL